MQKQSMDSMTKDVIRLVKEHLSTTHKKLDVIYAYIDNNNKLLCLTEELKDYFPSEFVISLDSGMGTKISVNQIHGA